MSKLVEVFAVEMGKAVNDCTEKVCTSRDGYPSAELIEQALLAHGCRYANVKKLYRLEKEHE